MKKNNELISFLMVGQSNMAGRGYFHEVAPIENPLCFMLRMGIWKPLSEPVNPDRSIFATDFHSGISLAASFADEFANYYQTRIGLIPCADGGTVIAQWQPGEILFDHAVMMAKLAMRTSTLGGILWHQGEGDCPDYNPEKYSRDFHAMVNAFRKELENERLPFIIGEISEQIAPKWGCLDHPPKMNRLLRKLCSEIPYCRIASSKYLPLKSDGVHFNSRACREFGSRYFDQYKELYDELSSQSDSPG